jgi:hypothetical protein
MDTDLVGAAGLESGLQIRERGKALLDPVPGHRALALALRQDGHALAVLRVAADGCVDDAFARSDPTVDDRQVPPPDRPGLELGHQRVVSGRCLGHDQEPRGVLVEPVHDTGTAGPAHAGGERSVGEHAGGQRAPGMAGPGVDDHPGGLVEDEDVVVLVDDGERDRLGLELGGRRRRDLDVHALATAQAVRGPAGRAVHPHAPGGDQRLQAGAGELGHGLGQPAIQAGAGGGGGHTEPPGRHLEAGRGAGRASRRMASTTTPTLMAESARLKAGQCQSR